MYRQGRRIRVRACVCVRARSTWSVPKVMRMIFLRSAEGPGNESGGRGRWRGNPGIQFDLPQLSPRLCSSRYVSKVRRSFVSCHGWKCRGVWRSVTWLSSARNSENLVPKRCNCWQLMGMLFCLQPKSSGGTRRSRTEGTVFRTNSRHGVLQLQEQRTMWLVWRLFWIGTDVWMCG